MKKNHLMIGITIISILLAGFLFGKQWMNKPEKSEIEKFLQTLSNDIKTKPADSILAKFDVKQPDTDVIRIINLLAGKTAVNGESKALFTTAFNIHEAETTIKNESLSSVKIPIILSQKSLPDYTFSLNMELRKESPGKFKIIVFNGEEVFSDFVAFENAIKSKMYKEDDIFSPATLSAFKVAEQLKSRYDSVVWFSYVDNKPYYYVVNGEWEIYTNLYDNTPGKKHQLGLVNSELREIIPAEFDLIHNIGGTFKHLIEVEKKGKRGFYDLNGKVVLPVVHDQIIPIEDSVNIAVASIGNNYFWIRKDFSISEPDSSIKIADILKKVKVFANSSTLRDQNVTNLLEYNSRQNHASLYLPPSYLVDWKLLPVVKQFKNPWRKNVEIYDISSSVELQFAKRTETSNWLETVFYSIRDNYIGGRSEFYESKNVLMVDSRSNKVYSYETSSEFNSGKCDDFNLRAVSDTLFELKATEYAEIPVGDKYLIDMPVYHYLIVKEGKLQELPSRRKFSFTKFIRLNNSYLHGCFVLDEKQIDELPEEMLHFMKMEIYAEYNLSFPDERWRKLFSDLMPGYTPEHTKVDKYLTEIDVYNINWLDQRLKTSKTKSLAQLK